MDREKCPNCKGFLKKIKKDHWYWYCPKCDRKYEEWELYDNMESHYKSTHSSARTERQPSELMVEGSNPPECVLPEYTRLGGKKKKIRLARTQATLF